ncbi:MAG: DUF3418 domain-containing protein, partial [Angustibacter sp.]
DDDVLFDFYDERIPAEVISGRHFDSWWKAARREDPDLLTFSPELLLREQASQVAAEDFPNSWSMDGVSLRISYQFEPGTTDDGATVHVPLPILRDLRPEPFSWHVPGLRLELVTALLRGLPKSVRRSLIPAPDRAADVLHRISPADGPLLPTLAAGLRELTGTVIAPDDWDWRGLPEHLRITYLVQDEAGRELGRGKDLRELQDRLQPELRSRLAQSAGVVARTGLLAWSIDTLAQEQSAELSGHVVAAFPALVDEGKTVGVQLFADLPAARRAHAIGVRRLVRLTTPNPVPKVLARLSNEAKLVLSRADYTGASDLMDDAVAAAVDVLLGRAGELPRDPDSFAALSQQASRHLVTEVLGVMRALEPILTGAHEMSRELDGLSSPALAPARADLSRQLNGLIYPGFITEVGAEKLPDVQRYLAAMRIRVERLVADPRREESARQQLETAEGIYRQVLAGIRPGTIPDPDVARIFWMIQELRVSLFAPTMKTAYSISVQRINRAARELIGREA